jgi:hypothetical protein
MKLVIRISAVILALAGAVAGNSLPKNPAVVSAAVHNSAVPGPIPVCDPWGTQTCNIR